MRLEVHVADIDGQALIRLLDAGWGKEFRGGEEAPPELWLSYHANDLDGAAWALRHIHHSLRKGEFLGAKIAPWT